LNRPVVIVAVLGGLALLVWVAAHALIADGVPSGTRVLGVPIGGLSVPAATAKLDRELADRVASPVSVNVGGSTYDVDATKAGLSLDTEATVAAAGAGSWNPIRLARAVFGGHDIEPVRQVDAAALERAVTALAKRADGAVRDGAVRFSGAKVTVVQPRTGVKLDRSGAAQRISQGWLLTEGAVQLPAKKTEPAVSAGEVRRVLSDFAQPAVSGPVTLSVGGRDVVVPPAAIGAALSVAADGDGRLQPTLDGAALARGIVARTPAVEQKPRDATFRFTGGRPVVVPSRPGRTIDPAQLSTAVLAVLPSRSDRTASVPLVTTEPKLTTAQAQALGITEVVSEFTTHYPYASYRVTNIGRAARLINGTVLKPGETFSLNKIVGERTAANGFAKGITIRNGRFFEDFGGGVSQVATTTFNAMFFAGLQDVQHKPHSFYISRYPEGREATVAWPTVDLKFTNNTKYGVYIQTSHRAGSSVTVRMWSTKHRYVTSAKGPRYKVKPFKTVYDPTSTCVPQGGVVGFDVNVARTVREAGQATAHQTFHTHYIPEDRVFCRPKPTPKPVVTAPPTPSGSASPSPSPSPKPTTR
jgi:vancomycin resistance protein YoaR